MCRMMTKDSSEVNFHVSSWLRVKTAVNSNVSHFFTIVILFINLPPLRDRFVINFNSAPQFQDPKIVFFIIQPTIALKYKRTRKRKEFDVKITLSRLLNKYSIINLMIYVFCPQTNTQKSFPKYLSK